MTVGRWLELAVTIMVLAATPATGRYDRGGQQHSITWGRANSHSSAIFGNIPTNVTAVFGHRARLPCQVKNLGLKDVSWIRQRDLHILTVGIFTYTSDDRFQVVHLPESDHWYLDILSVTFRDAGVYECQVSNSPKVSLPIRLIVLGVQEADIIGPREVYIQHGSTISLHCEVQAGVEVAGAVLWLKGSSTLNYSSPRGGISMEVEKTPTKTMSKLYITRAVKTDSGNYTCAPVYALPDSVKVMVVNAGEESAAAVHSSVEALRAGVGIMWVSLGSLWATTLMVFCLMSVPSPRESPALYPAHVSHLLCTQPT
ncbi:protein sidekick-1-like isoform X1 [Cherax quadricarinatus]